MRVETTLIEGLLAVTGSQAQDHRGALRRLVCIPTLAEAGVLFEPRQISLVSSPQAGTLRGLHWQAQPYSEVKWVQATRGSAFDVVVDLRHHSATRLEVYTTHLTEDNRRALVIPAGCAHGVYTLVPDTELLYAIDQPYQDGARRGIRYDDPKLGIRWPDLPAVISERDLNLPLLDEIEANLA